MEVKATAKYIKVQPRKVRRVANEVRGENAVRMVHVLRFHPSKSASALRKVIMSAIANAEENHGAEATTLKVSRIEINEGPVSKRIIARAMGRANRIMKKTSHITVTVEPADEEAKVKPHGTQAKARPTFDKPKAKKAKKTEEPVAEAAAPVAEAEPEVIEEAPVETTEAPVEAEATEAPAEAVAEEEAPAASEEETK